MTFQDPTWNMDTGATSHLIYNAHNLSTIFNTRHSIIPSIHRPLHLHNVLVTPNIIKNLICVRQFTRDNNCTIEFNAFGFSMKDFLTPHILLRCDSSGDLYPVTKPSTTPTAFLSTSVSTWHQCLSYLGDEVLRSLVSRPAVVNMVRSMWLFKHNLHADGTLSRYKARLVANGSSQQLGVDFDETFSPVVKPATIRTVLSLAVSRKWPIHQLDVKNAFLNGDLSKTVYMHQPPGFVDAWFPKHVCHLLKSLYASSPTLLRQIIDSLYNEFDMIDLGALNYFLDLSYAVQRVYLYMHDLREPHYAALKRILVICLRDYGIWSPVICFRYYFSAKRQHTLSRSSAEAEYRGVANVVAETAWLRNLFCELHSPLSTATLVYCDNVSAVYMSANHVQHQWTKHIEIDIHFVQDKVTAGQVRVLHVPSRYQYDNIFTKGLPSALFEEFQSILSVHPPPALTAGAYLPLYVFHIYYYRPMYLY
nr:hypothetical protein [Tanacetum cinerariifolium]